MINPKNHVEPRKFKPTDLVVNYLAMVVPRGGGQMDSNLATLGGTQRRRKHSKGEKRARQMISPFKTSMLKATHGSVLAPPWPMAIS